MLVWENDDDNDEMKFSHLAILWFTISFSNDICPDQLDVHQNNF